jgi:hypothetical protein
MFDCREAELFVVMIFFLIVIQFCQMMIRRCDESEKNSTARSTARN